VKAGITIKLKMSLSAVIWKLGIRQINTSDDEFREEQHWG
jgi:hypothetical protein